MNLSPKIVMALIFLFFLNAIDEVFAAQVAAVKGNQVLVIGDDLQKDGLYFVVEEGKKKGIIKILQIKGRKAKASLVKGSATKGASLVYRAKKTATNQAETQTRTKTTTTTSTKSKKNYDVYSEEPKNKFSDSSKYSKSSPKSLLSIGGLLAYQQNSASIESGSVSDSLSGSSFGIKVFGDYAYSNNINLRGEFGTIPFEAEGDSLCGGQTCNMSINYLGGSIMARYMFGQNPSVNRFWVGAGLGLMFPLDTGNTNAVVADDVGSTLIFNLGGGYDYNINEKYFIPFGVEYLLFPPSDNVSASSIILKAGLGMRL